MKLFGKTCSVKHIVDFHALSQSVNKFVLYVQIHKGDFGTAILKTIELCSCLAEMS